VLIIVVFDPLAVLMLIAANQGLREWRGDEPSETKTVIETIPDAVPEYPAAEPEANGTQTVTLNIEGKDELIAAVQGLRDEMAALNAAIAAPAAEPVSTPDLANLSGVVYSEEKVPEPVTVVPQNHTFSYNADVGIATIATDNSVQIIETISDDQISFDFDAEPEVLVKPPIAEDDIAEEDLARLAQLPTEPEAQEAKPESIEDAERQWQIIDQLPEVKTSEDGTKTVHEFMDELRDRHRQRIDRHTNTNTDN
jgi:hypothetical protein